MAFNLHIFAFIDKTLQLSSGRRKQDCGQFLEVALIAFVYVVLLAFGEPVDEKGPLAFTGVQALVFQSRASGSEWPSQKRAFLRTFPVQATALVQAL